MTAASGAPNDPPLQADAIAATCLSADGRIIEGSLLELDLGSRLVMESAHDGAALTIAAEDLVRVEFDDRPQPQPAGGVIDLANGDRIYGSIVDGNEETATIESSPMDRLVIPLVAVRMVRTARADNPQWRQRAADLAASPEGGMDRLLMSNGDVVDGIIAAVDGDAWMVEVAGDIRRMDAALVIAARLQPISAEPATGIHARLNLEDGSRVTVSSLRITPSAEAKCVCYGRSSAITPQSIRTIEVRGGRSVPLTDFTPARYENTPMMSVGWDYRINASVTGGPLRVAGRTYDEGIGVHSRSLLVYDLAGRYKEFVTQFGFDDTAGELAHVNVVIRVDGRPMLETEVAGGDALHKPVRIPVAGADRLELLVDFGKNAAVQDRFDWIEPSLVR